MLSQDYLPGSAPRFHVFFLSLSLSLSLSISFFFCLSSNSKGVNVFTAKLSTGAMVLVDVLQVAIQYHELVMLFERLFNLIGYILGFFLSTGYSVGYSVGDSIGFSIGY